LGYKSEEVIEIDPGIFLQGPETPIETIREILNYTKIGDKIWFYLNIAAVYDDVGKLINYVAVENDITPKKWRNSDFKKLWKKNANSIALKPNSSIWLCTSSALSLSSFVPALIYRV